MKIAREIADATFGLYAYGNNALSWFVDDTVDKARIETIIAEKLEPIKKALLIVRPVFSHDRRQCPNCKAVFDALALFKG